MYRCGVCGTLSQPRARRLLHVVYREVVLTRVTAKGVVTGPVKQIDREVPVCRRCKECLDGGETLEELQDRMDPLTPVPAVLEPVLATPPPRGSTVEPKSPGKVNGSSPKTRYRNPLFGD